MTLTYRQSLFVVVITLLALLLITEFTPSGFFTASQTLVGVICIISALFLLTISMLMARGKLKPGLKWGRSATEAFWQGIYFLLFGLGNLSFLVVESAWAMRLKLMGALIGIIALFLGFRSRKVVAEI